MRNLKSILVLIGILILNSAMSQNTTVYSTYNAHSHNDYELSLIHI